MLNAQPAQAQTTNTNRRVIARFLNSPEDPANLTLLAQYGASIHWHSLMLPGLVSINCPNQNGSALAKALSASPSVKYAENISNPGSFSAPPCPGHAGSNLVALDSANVSSYQWAWKNSGKVVANVVGTVGADANMIPAWQVTTGSPDIVVAVIDTSVSIDHPALVNSLWTNQNETPGDNIDNDGNGIVDDVHGAKFAEDASGNLLIQGDPRPVNTGEFYGHGTSAAGLVFSSHTFGVKGVAPGCKLMAIALLDGAGANFEFEFMAERLVMAFDYALYMKARVSSVSLYGFHQQSARRCAFVRLRE